MAEEGHSLTATWKDTLGWSQAGACLVEHTHTMCRAQVQAPCLHGGKLHEQ